ncbi:MAG: ATP-dependent helicase HrpB [Chthoniobacterales bacterium]|nr:ATP-dependent helicase HrpB [Chthoniobacterales bacterium]
MELLIETERGRLVEVLKKSRRVVLCAPPGAGKSTRVPRILAEEVFPEGGQILVLEPRRLAARMLATRVAAELGERVGGTVGYQVRFERVCSQKTRIVFLTEGLFLRRLLGDRHLAGVRAVILDEFHERSLATDLALGVIRRLQAEVRPDLLLMVMSATLESDKILDYLGSDAALFEMRSNEYPVEIRWTKERALLDVPIWELAARTIANEFLGMPRHALVFMPGASEIARTIEAIRRTVGGGVPVFGLHGEMSAEAQDAAISPSEKKKIIVSTNIAETSLTIEGVTLVVDSGLARIARYDPVRGLDTLYVEAISRASADQRAGRAGRTGPGVCVRLWSEASHGKRPVAALPEIQRVDLAEAVLELLALGFCPRRFEWLDEPLAESVERSLGLLRDVGAISGVGELSEVGWQMARIPAHPRIGRMLLEALRVGCIGQTCVVAAVLQSRPLFAQKGPWQDAKKDCNSDFQVIFKGLAKAVESGFDKRVCEGLGIRADVARGVMRLAGQFLREVGSVEMERGREVDVSLEWVPGMERCLAAAFGDRIGCRRSRGSQRFELVGGCKATLPMTSAARDAELVVAGEVFEVGDIKGKAEARLGLVTRISEEVLEELFPGELNDDRQVIYDDTLGRVVERHRRFFRGMCLWEKLREVEDTEAAAACLVKVVRERGMGCIGWGEAEEQFLLRLEFAARNFPECGITLITDDEIFLLLEEHCKGMTSLREVRQKPFLPTLMGWLSEEESAFLEEYAPTRLRLPSGRMVKLQYEKGGGVRFSAKIQDIYGLEEVPLVGGKVPAVVEVLAPNNRAVQVTNDLRSFWERVYPAIRDELRRRYPKHEWRC